MIQQLIHLLFSVAGGLPYDQVGKVGVRAFIGNGKPVAGFDQRAQVFRQIRFRRRDRFCAHAAQAHRGKSRRIQNFRGSKGAEYSGNMATVILYLLYFEEPVFPGIAKFCKLCRQISCHPFYLSSFMGQNAGLLKQKLPDKTLTAIYISISPVFSSDKTDKTNKPHFDRYKRFLFILTFLLCHPVFLCVLFPSIFHTFILPGRK